MINEDFPKARGVLGQLLKDYRRGWSNPALDRYPAHWPDSTRAGMNADQSNIENGIQMLELASEAHQLFREQEPKEKRRLLDFIVARASWKEGRYPPAFGHPLT